MDANGREFRLLHKLSEQAEANDFRWVEGEARAGVSIDSLDKLHYNVNIG